MGWLGMPPGLAPPGPPVGAMPGGGMHLGGAAAYGGGSGVAAPGWPAAQQGQHRPQGKAVLWNAAVGGEAQAAAIAPDPASSSRVSLAEPGTPMILWCEAKPTRQQEVIEALASYYTTARPQLVYLETTSRFTRWLFEQPRGDVKPWALLVCGWREAKPCAMAIGAARTGDVSVLRPDARRPELPPITGSPQSGMVGVAIESMIVVLGKDKEEARVVMWAGDSGKAMAGLDIHVAGDTCPIQDVMANMKGSRSSKLSL